MMDLIPTLKNGSKRIAEKIINQQTIKTITQWIAV